MDQWQQNWESKINAWVSDQMATADSGHGIDHVRRVVENSKRIGTAEQACPEVYLAAAWLHDCVSLPKNSPDRHLASTLAANKAEQYLASINYPDKWVARIQHCIQAHSFSAKIPCLSLEAQVVQDADRLEAVGAIGLARCLMTGGSMKQRLYNPDQPFPIDRPPQDTEQSVDHFFTKLLGLHKTMQTQAGRVEAKQRTEFLDAFLRQLCDEIGTPREELEKAIKTAEVSRP